ncbi:MFS transporter [Pseudomonadota bacterium]
MYTNQPIETKNKLKTQIPILILSIFSYFVVVGIAAVTFPVILKTNNVTETLIGFSDNIKIISGLIILTVLPRIAHSLGIIGAGIFSLVLYGVSLLLLPIYQNYLIWAVLMALFGAGFIVFRTMEETLTNIIASNHNRGRIMGMTSTAMLAGVSIGPVLVKFFGVTEYKTFVIAFVLSVISGICFYLLRDGQGDVKPSKKLNLVKHVKELPMVFFSKFVLEFFVQVLFVFGVIYSMEKGYKAEDGGLFITFFSLSGFLNVFIGHMVDKVKSRYITMTIGVLILFITMTVFSFIVQYKLLSYLLFFIFGFGASMIFLSSMSILNSFYNKSNLVSANSALTITDSIGMISGGILTGISIDLFGIQGFFLPMAILGVIYVLFGLFYYIPRKKV